MPFCFVSGALKKGNEEARFSKNAKCNMLLNRLCDRVLLGAESLGWICAERQVLAYATPHCNNCGRTLHAFALRAG